MKQQAMLVDSASGQQERARLSEMWEHGRPS